ncbi:tetratricopeptide repeat protein [Hirschia litorea]|uniref:Tetratricopeptide repeat protein n=1 Tax=Hirschia litorea TaxID=1199156 RepID=A0ABW2IJB3_9PROT
MRRFSFKQSKLTQVCASVFLGCVLSGCAVSSSTEKFDAPVLQLSQSGVSKAAASTKAEGVVEYANANEMLENADMSAFMLEAREAYANSEKSGAWGFTAVDMMLAGEYPEALTVLNEMPVRESSFSAVMTPDFLRPWILAAKGDVELAKEAIEPLKNTMPDHAYRGYQALLLEGAGLYEEAIGIYQQGPDYFDRPDDDEEPSAENYARFLMYSAERQLALRHAELLVKLDRKPGAMVIYNALLHANEDDAYTDARMEELSHGKKLKKPFLTVHSALGIAINDQADLIEQRQELAGVMLAKGAKAPFNHFLSALRQSALLLNPNSALIRLTESEHLYSHGFFEPSARLALNGDALTDEDRASLLLRASEAKLEAGNFAAMDSLNKKALALTDEPISVLNVADLMVRISNVEEAEKLVSGILKKDDLDTKTRAYANILLAEARQQGGNLEGATLAARAAVLADETDQTRGFLASTLTKSEQTREEGLDIYRDLFVAAPDSPSMMNNFGYALIASYSSDKELDEGYRLLKKANRMTPFEPNLLDSLGWAYYQYGDYERAQELIEKALELFEPFDHWELHYHLGDVYWRLDRKEDAVKSWETALEQHPPAHEREAIASRIENGLTEAAPEARVPPFVPKTEAPPEAQSI